MKVNCISSYLDNIITVSEGSDNNLKLWKILPNNLQLIDEKTFTFIQLLKSGYVSLKAVLMLPPRTATTAFTAKN